MSKLVFLNTETGGTNPNIHSLLSIGMVLYEDKKITYRYYWEVKQNQYTVTPESMSINKLNLERLKNEGNLKKIIRNKIVNSVQSFVGFENKAILAGHNIKFDIGFVKELFGFENYNSYFSYKTVDTFSILKFLYHSGYFEKDISCIKEAFDYFDILPKDNTVNNALDDIVLTANLYTKLINLLEK